MKRPSPAMQRAERWQAYVAYHRRAATRRSYPRTGEPWTPAEDRRLLRLVERVSNRDGRRWWRVATRLGRSTLACQGRYYTLRAMLRRMPEITLAGALGIRKRSR